MDIYLTNLKTKERLRFPMLPTEINVDMANQFESYTILNIGEVKIPNRAALDGFSWNGILPGKRRKKDPYIRKWQKPDKVYKWISKLKPKGGKPIKARLLITGTPVNCDVYLSSFTATPTGGYGDINYSISLVQAKTIKLKKKGDVKKKSSKKKAGKELKNKPKNEERTSPPAAKTYTVKSGDSLWKIAQKLCGSGSQYTKLYNANKGVIGNNPNLIYPGQVLKIPA